MPFCSGSVGIHSLSFSVTIVWLITEMVANRLSHGSPSVGVKKFLVAGGVQIQEFKVQFKTQQRKNENEWGAPFVHSKGTCYWVNAIIGH